MVQKANENSEAAAELSEDVKDLFNVICETVKAVKNDTDQTVGEGMSPMLDSDRSKLPDIFS